MTERIQYLEERYALLRQRAAQLLDERNQSRADLHGYENLFAQVYRDNQTQLARLTHGLERAALLQMVNAQAESIKALQRRLTIAQEQCKAAVSAD
jgi:hypothetical protein